MDLLHQLRVYGLGEKEAQVYISLLKLGPSTVNSIAEDCDLIRTTTYDILKSLREKAIVASIVKNNIYYFEAADPEKLIKLLEEKKHHIQSIIPQLRSLRKEVSELPRSEIFEGKEGLKTAYHEILRKKQPLYCISNNELMVGLLDYGATRFIEERVKAKIPIKILSEPSETTRDLLMKKDKKEFRQTRVLPQLKDIKLNQYITEDSVAILGSRSDEPIGIIVHHKDFAQEQRLLFEILWSTAKP